MNCGVCGNSRKNSENGVYCALFGIMIHRRHQGCRYFREKDEGNDTDRNRLAGPAKKQ